MDDIDRVNDRIKPSHTKGDRVSEEAQHKKPIQIYIATIDSLANNFATIPANIAPDSDEFDKRIVQATNNLERNDKFFFDKDGTNIFNHIIVDEAQDLSEERYEFIMKIFSIIKANSNHSNASEQPKVVNVPVRNTITFFGDPRQRLSSKAGQRFQRMLSDNSDANICKVSFTRTFRFSNAKLLDICNQLSSMRPEIHVPLVNANPFTIDEKVKVFSDVKDVSDTILTLVKERNVLPH